MTAAVKDATLVGGLIGSPANSGSALFSGVYTVAKASQSDWAILSDFDELKECVVYTVSAGARTAEAFTIDASIKNKIVFTSATTGSVSVLAFGTLKNTN